MYIYQSSLIYEEALETWQALICEVYQQQNPAKLGEAPSFYCSES